MWAELSLLIIADIFFSYLVDTKDMVSQLGELYSVMAVLVLKIIILLFAKYDDSSQWPEERLWEQKGGNPQRNCEWFSPFTAWAEASQSIDHFHCFACSFFLTSMLCLMSKLLLKKLCIYKYCFDLNGLYVVCTMYYVQGFYKQKSHYTINTFI